MKRKYNKPTVQVTQFLFEEHITAGSGGGQGSTCWGSVGNSGQANYCGPIPSVAGTSCR